MDHNIVRSIASPSHVSSFLPQAPSAINPSQALPRRKAVSDASSLEESTIDSQDEKSTDSGYASRNLSCRSSKSSNSNEGAVFVVGSKLFTVVSEISVTTLSKRMSRIAPHQEFVRLAMLNV
jgi:hypothetical protein